MHLEHVVAVSGIPTAHQLRLDLVLNARGPEGGRRRGPRPLFSSSWLHVNYALDLYRICGGVPL